MTDSPEHLPWPLLAETAASSLGRTFRFGRARRLHGDGAAAAWRLEADDGACVFVKTTTIARADDLVAERDGLVALAAAASVRVPRVLAIGEARDHAFLMLEHLRLRPLRGESAARLGEALASLHRVPGDTFGWHRDNLLGRSLQRNAPTTDWLSFWRGQRLGPQVEALADARTAVGLQRVCRDVLDRLDTLIGGHRPQPSLLHGDLWSGNLAEDENGAPVIFDPAVYRGDREVDLAMTSLFGGVPGELASGYCAAWPLPPGHERRRHLYNLHHAVNHVLLFGPGWEPLALRLAERLR